MVRIRSCCSTRWFTSRASVLSRCKRRGDTCIRTRGYRGYEMRGTSWCNPLPRTGTFWWSRLVATPLGVEGLDWNRWTYHCRRTVQQENTIIECSRFGRPHNITLHTLPALKPHTMHNKCLLLHRNTCFVSKTLPHIWQRLPPFSLNSSMIAFEIKLILLFSNIHNLVVAICYWILWPSVSI